MSKAKENIYAPKGFFTSSIMMHVDRLKHVLKIDDKLPLWLRIRYIKVKLEDPNHEPTKNVFIPDNKVICDLALEHCGWMKYTSSLLDFCRNDPCKHFDRDTITPKMYDSFRFSLYDIDVPVELWTDRYLLHKMTDVKKMLTDKKLIKEVLDTKPLTDRQATEVIAKFMPLLDKILRDQSIVKRLKNEFIRGKCYICHKKRKSITPHEIDSGLCVNVCFSCRNKHQDTKPLVDICNSIGFFTIKEFNDKRDGYEKFFTSKDGNNIFTIDPLTGEQATKMVDLFSKWLVIGEDND